MPTFPAKPADVLALVKTMAAGLAAHPEIFPNPPYPPDDLNAEAELYGVKHDANTEAQAHADATKDAEKTVYERMKAKAKAIVAYAIHITHEERELNLVGWSNRSAPTPTPPPGQPLSLQSPRHGDGTVFLSWEAASLGGKVQAYKIQRRELHTDGPDTAWVDCGMSVTTEKTLTNQPKGLMLEYHVIAVNLAGDSSPSNVVGLTM
jgi:hypothetical protein